MMDKRKKVIERKRKWRWKKRGKKRSKIKKKIKGEKKKQEMRKVKKRRGRDWRLFQNPPSYYFGLGEIKKIWAPENAIKVLLFCTTAYLPTLFLGHMYFRGKEKFLNIEKKYIYIRRRIITANSIVSESVLNPISYKIF